jgi:Zn-dependent peptidase ImmA (M78 family)
MRRSDYYDLLKAKAREVRASHNLTTPKVMLSDMRRIYRTLGIKIDYWKGKLRKVRGAYTNIDNEPCVMVYASLPEEQRIFTLAHELKHHFFDQGEGRVDVDNEASEIGAEIFAVELIFPDGDFHSFMQKLGVAKGCCTAESIVRLKRQSQTTLSFASLAKRATHHEYALPGSFDAVKWRKLEESIFGEPEYKRILRYKAAKTARESSQ